MSKFSYLPRLAGFVAGLGLLATGAAGPAFAKDKPGTVTVPGSVFKEPSSRLCMPREKIPGPVDKSQPKTMCLTQEEWTAKGVTFIVK